MASPTLADILINGGGDVTTADLAAAIAEKQKRGALPNFDASGRWSPPSAVRASTPGYNPKDTIADDAKAAAASAADPLGFPSAMVGLYSPGARDAWRGSYESRPFAATVGSAAAPYGLYGKGLKAAGEAIKEAPKLSTALLAGLGITGGADEAGSAKLKPSQERALEIEKQRKQQDLDAERQRATDKADLEARQRQQEADFARDEASKEAVKPFRERHPVLNSFMPAIATGTAFGTGALVKGGLTLAQALRAPYMREAVTKAEAAIASGDNVAATLALKELQQFNKAANTNSVGKQATGAAAGGIVGTEIGMQPSKMDRESLPAGNPDREAASETLSDWKEWGKRAALNTAAGWGGFKVAGTIPGPAMPTERAASLSSILKSGFGDEAAIVAKNLQAARGPKPTGAAEPVSPPSPAGSPAASPASQASQGTPSPRTPEPTPASPPPSAPSGATGSEPSLSSVLKGESGHHSVRQNRVKGKFSGGFKGEKE